MMKIYSLTENGKIIGSIVQFPDGSAVLKWMNEDDSIVVYKSMADLLKVHEKGDRKVNDRLFLF